MTISIAIDGHSGSGKSTLARQLAQRLGFTYVDTGALYRAVTLKILTVLGKEFTGKQLERLLENTKVSIEQGDNGNRIILDGNDVTDTIREPQVSDFVSAVASKPAVRKHLIDIQRDNARGKNVILEGRDIGTVVLPKATFKFFITASIDARAQRRLEELLEKGISISFEEVKKNLIERDDQDSTRKTSPLKKAADAITIDSSNMTAEEKLNLVAHYITNTLQNREKKIYNLYKTAIRVIAKILFRLEFIYEDYDSARLFSGMVTSNHCSNLDPPLVGNALPYPLYFLAKEELCNRTESLPNRLFFNHVNMIGIDRDNPKPKSIRQVLNALKAGHSVLIFPEGTRSDDGEIKEAKTGPGMLAYRAHVPILPMYISGSFDALPRHRKWIKPSKITVYVGKPYSPDYESLDRIADKKARYQKLSSLMLNRIKAVKEQCEK